LQLGWAKSTVRAAALAAALFCAWLQPGAFAASTVEFLSSLTDAEVTNFQDWREARQAYEQKLDAYWDKVDAKRSERKKKRASKTPFDANDYVMVFPPAYAGPKLSAELAKKYAKFSDDQEKAQPTPPKEMSTVADYLDAAKQVYSFTPERLSEKEFKRRYAEEASPRIRWCGSTRSRPVALALTICKPAFIRSRKPVAPFLARLDTRNCLTQILSMSWRNMARPSSTV
jgi:hypothetical protein